MLLVLCASRYGDGGNSARSAMSQVDSLAKVGEYEAAVDLLENLDARLYPDSALLLRKGLIYRKIDNVESRRKSAHALQTLTLTYPLQSSFYLEYATTLLAQGFDDEAKAQLRKVITLVPTAETAYLMLSDIYASRYYINSWKREADQAESTLQALLRRVPTSRAGYCKLASLQAVRGRIGEALGNAKRAEIMDSLAVDMNLILGYVQYQLRHYDLSQRHFDRALRKMSRFDKWVYTTVECVLPPQVAAEYPNWKPAIRDSLERDFWRTRDSDPTTEVNERQLEHYCRVWEANLYFGSLDNGGVGWRTPMGATLVRMGRPDGRRRALEEVHWSRNKHFIDESPVWYWSYGSSETPCSFAFLDRYLNNKYTYPKEGYDNRLSSYYQASEAVAAAVFTAKPEQSSLLRTVQPIAISFDGYQFRSVDGKTALLVDMTFSAKDLALDTSVSKAATQFSVRRVLRTRNQELVWQRSDEQSLYQKQMDSLRNAGVWRDQFALSAAPGDYQLSLACEQPRLDRLGIVNQQLRLESFAGVSLSDLLLTSDTIVNPKLGDFWRQERQDKVIPQRVFSSSRPMTICFEIYNLPTDVYRQTSYEISYTLQLVKPTQTSFSGLVSKILPKKRESVTTSLHEIGMSSNLARALAIDLSEMREGDYTLTLRLTDLIHNQTTSKTTSLTLRE